MFAGACGHWDNESAHNASLAFTAVCGRQVAMPAWHFDLLAALYLMVRQLLQGDARLSLETRCCAWCCQGACVGMGISQPQGTWQ